MFLFKLCILAFVGTVLSAKTSGKKWCKTHQEALMNMTETIATFAENGVKCGASSEQKEGFQTLIPMVRNLVTEVAATKKIVSEIKESSGIDSSISIENAWEIRRCDLDTQVTSATAVTLDGTFGTAAAQEQCQAISSRVVKSANYEISVDIFNKQGWSGASTGHPGIIFNAQNSKNYDMVYVRPHSSTGCYQTGYLINGKWAGILSKSCPKGPPKGGVWFNLKVKMLNKRAIVYLNGDEIANYTPHYSSKGQGGVFLWLGYNNIASYKSFSIK